MTFEIKNTEEDTLAFEESENWELYLDKSHNRLNLLFSCKYVTSMNSCYYEFFRKLFDQGLIKEVVKIKIDDWEVTCYDAGGDIVQPF